MIVFPMKATDAQNQREEEDMGGAVIKDPQQDEVENLVSSNHPE